MEDESCTAILSQSIRWIVDTVAKQLVVHSTYRSVKEEEPGFPFLIHIEIKIPNRPPSSSPSPAHLVLRDILHAQEKPNSSLRPMVPMVHMRYLKSRKRKNRQEKDKKS